MKSQIVDGARTATIGTMGSFSTWALQDVNLVIAIFVGVGTGVFILLQTAKLLYSWYWEHRGRMYKLKHPEVESGDSD